MTRVILATDARALLLLGHESKWDTDSWIQRPWDAVGTFTWVSWSAEGDAFRGCHTNVKYHVECHGFCLAPSYGTVEISATLPWTGDPQHHCTLVQAVHIYRRHTLHCTATSVSLTHQSYGLGARRLEVTWGVEAEDACDDNPFAFLIEACRGPVFFAP